jgi:hypothetical protein
VELLTGQVDRQQMDLTALDDHGNARATPEFLQALSTALGVTVTGAFFEPTATFTKLTAG